MEHQIDNPRTNLTLIKDPSHQTLGINTHQNPTQKLQQFLQLQIDLLAAQSEIQWIEVVYHDPQTPSQRKVIEASQTPFPGLAETKNYLQTEQWLENSIPTSALKPIVEKAIETGFYCYQFGEQSHSHQYLLVFAKKGLSHTCRQLIKRTAAGISAYLDNHRQNGQQRQQIEILEDVVKRVGHQLHHPLSLIHLYAHNLNRVLPKGKEQEQVAVIGKTAHLLSQSLTEIMQCASSEKLQITPQDLRSLIYKILEDFQGWIDEKCLQIFCTNHSLTLDLDPMQIKQAFSNLLSNAIHFSPHGAKIFINWQEQTDNVLLTFTDEGSGLSPEDQQKLFKPFYTKREGGTGLGMAITKKVVLDHGGNIWARNAPNKGAEFLISLPRFVSAINHQTEKTAC
jgi:signal transduction histidine kinase